MDEKLKQVEQTLAKYGQEQLLDEYNRLTDKKEKQDFLDSILTIDFNQVKTLYENSKEKPSFMDSKIEPIDYTDKSKLSKEEYEKYKAIGEKKIKDGKLAVVTMAGGQGTRLGHSGPKGTYDLGLDTHKSIFEILTDTLNEARKKYEVDIPWYIMTSEENNNPTVEFFKQHNFFGYPEKCVTFFKQGKLPMLSTDGKILIDENGKIKEAADGHGGIFQSMLRDGVIYDMKARGIEWVFIGGVDNVLVKPVDAVLIGLAEDKNVLAAGKSLVKANPQEKVGVFCKRNGKPSVIEYSEITAEMAAEKNEKGELKYGESHILCNLFNIKAIEKISQMNLPYHIAFKKAKYIDNNGNLVVPDKPNAYKFESFLFDAFESLDDLAIMRVKREEEFAPVKNAEGVDSPETARKLYLDFHEKNK
jgi:UDP-N-acetylglucosamine/UDP-N-acetylgalactosamine diphosphorylase